MIFFISISFIAIAPAINIVIDEVISKDDIKNGVLDSIGLNRNRRNTPAVTRVDEWTRADTGVGAAIAAGSQEENGT